MTEKCLTPCAFDEEIRVDIENVDLGHRTFLFNFPVRICQTDSVYSNDNANGAYNPENASIDTWIDSSGSLAPEKVEQLKAVAIKNGFDVWKTGDERWIDWALQSALRGRSSYLFINESTVYRGGGERMYLDLARFGEALPNFPKPIFMELIIVDDNEESRYLKESASVAFASGIFDGINAKKRETPDVGGDFFEDLILEKAYSIKIMRINGWAKPLIDALKIIFPVNNLNSLLNEDLFQREIFSYRSKKKINVSIKCGDSNNCPDGYCEIPSDEYPFYCCVKF